MLLFLEDVNHAVLHFDSKTSITQVPFQINEKSLQRWLDHELEVMVNVHEVRYEYEKQSQVYVLGSKLF